MTQSEPNGVHNRLEHKTPASPKTGTTTKPSPSTAVDDPSTTPSTSTRCHPTVYVVFGSLLLDLLAFTMILPLLPSLLEHYRQADGAGGLYDWLSQSVRQFQQAVGAPERYTSVLFGGMLGSMYSFLQFVASPIMGGLSDVYGRKPVMVVCLVSV